MESSAGMTKTRSKKRLGFKTRLFLCFKPVSSVDEAFEPIVYSSILSSTLTSVAEYNKGGYGWHRWRKKGESGHCFWQQVLKKALNELKKIKNRKVANKNQFSTSSSTKLYKKSNKISKEERQSNPSSLESSSSFSLRNSSSLTRFSLLASISSSSSSCTVASSSSSSSTNNYGNIFGFTLRRHEDAKDSRKGHAINNSMALCLIMITSLLVLILWGEFFAIICTSFLFYLVPCWSEQCHWLAVGHTETEEFDSVEYKKKIIMKGLLERNRNCLNIDSMAKS